MTDFLYRSKPKLLMTVIVVISNRLIKVEVSYLLKDVVVIDLCVCLDLFFCRYFVQVILCFWNLV